MQLLKITDQVEYGCNTQTSKPGFIFDEKKNYFRFDSPHWKGWWIGKGGALEEILDSTAVEESGVAKFVNPQTGGRVLFKIQKQLIQSSDIVRRSFLIPAVITVLGVVLVGSQVSSLIFYLFR